MALNDKKITSYTDNVKSLSDYPSDDGITAAQLKAIFDGRTDKEVKSAINGIIDELTATTGAAQIGTKDGNTVQAALDGKVSSDAGKGLSSNDFTDTEKAKLAGVETGANRTVVDSTLSAESANPVQNKAVQAALDSKVSAQAGKGLSTNDYTTAEKQKLSGIAEGATKTIVDEALSASSENPVQNKAVSAALDAKVNAANPQFSGTPTINTSGAGELRVRNNAGFQNFVEVSVTPGDADDKPIFTIKRGNTAETFDTGKIYTSYDPQPADSALSATSTNPVQNKAVKAALDAKANKNAPIIQNKLYVQTGTTDDTTPAAPHMSVFPASDGACIRYGEGNIMTPTLKITENGLFFNQDGDDYKVYAENNKPPVDAALSSTSTNPVQNKAVHAALAEKANIDTPWFSGDAVFSGGVNTTFNPKYKVLLSDNTAKLQFSSDISPIPDGLVFGDGSLKFLTAGKEYAVYTEGNPPPVERYNGASPIDPSTVRDIFRCAMTYTNNKDSFAYTSSGSGTLFDADFSASAPKIDCSSLMMAWIMGIPYEYSKYAGKDNIKHYGYGLDLPANPYASDRPNRYYTHELAHYFNEQGWCFKPNENYSNIAPGDIIFVSFASGDGQSEFHDSAYMQIDHCLLVLGYKDATHLTCLHTSASYTLNFFDVPILPSNYDSTSTSNYNDAIKLVARLPFRRSCGIVQTPVVTDATEKTTSTTNGLLATLTLSSPLKKNTPYTLVAHVENAATQTAPSSSNYFGIRASYSSGASDATIFSWQRNVNPKDNLYRCYFSVEDDPITQLKLYVLSTNVAGHKYKFCGLFEGLVAPTPNNDGTFN